MTVSQAITGALLPKAEAEVLLAHVLSTDRTWLLGHRDDVLGGRDWTRFMELVERRRTHEPISQIVGSVEFFGRRFSVTKDVLTPRPSTEGVVRGALWFLEGNRDGTEIVDEGIAVMRKELKRGFSTRAIGVIVDIGTGSGCIAVTLKLERPDLRVIATDISAEAVTVAKKNADDLGATIDFRVGSLLDPIKELNEPFLLVSNPPYISDAAQLMKDVIDFEPHVALFGGKDGGDIVRELAKQASEHPCCVGFVIECKANTKGLQ